MITHTPFIISNNQLLTSHSIWEKILDLNKKTLTIRVASNLDDTIITTTPPLITDLIISFNTWNPDYLDDPESLVMSHPDWVGGGPSRPSAEHTWNPFEQVWVAPPPVPLSEVQAKKWAEIKQARSTAEFGGFTWDGSGFDSSAISQQRISGALQLAMINPNYTVDWTLSNNTIRTLSAQDIIAVGIALGNHVTAQHEKARLLREQVYSATTAEQVNAISW